MPFNDMDHVGFFVLINVETPDMVIYSVADLKGLIYENFV